MSNGGFLARWARRKQQAIPEVNPESQPPALSASEIESRLKELTPESDFTAFLKEEVSEAVRRQAMKTLFSDPHFNVMDGLDTYIDDYSVSEPIPQAMLAGLRGMPGVAEEAFSQRAETENEGRDEGGEETCVAAEHCDILQSDGQNVAEALRVDDSGKDNL